MPEKKKNRNKKPADLDFWPPGILPMKSRHHRPISVIYYNQASRAQNKIQTVVFQILNRFNRLDLMDSVYTIVKEMAINAIKANMKRIILKEEKINVRNNDDYNRGTLIFRSRLNESWLEHYYQVMVEKGYSVIIKFYYISNRLLIEVINKIGLYKNEITRIKQKLAEGKDFESLLDFYTAHGDKTEGEGLGFSVITILLKNINSDPNSFKIITSNKNKTIAKVEISLNNLEIIAEKNSI
jgi:hypothetical protein